MKLSVLGCGAPVSHLPNVNTQSPSAYILEWGHGGKLLLECSTGIQDRLKKKGFDIAEIQHIFLSHIHTDHVGGFPSLYQDLWLNTLWEKSDERRLKASSTRTIYCSRQTSTNLLKILRLLMPESKGRLYPYPELNFVDIQNKARLELNGAKLTTVPTFHGSGMVRSLAIRVENYEGVFVYSGDTGICQGIEDICRGADLFLCEACAITDAEMRARGHLTPKQAGLLAKNGGVKKLVLTHLAAPRLHDLEPVIQEALSSGFAGKIQIAQDGDVINLP
ncbi:MAG: MBL fold metallo-hydrolase [Candidatus Doudnabacteria bacterium]|nr:MBL fold metallo-hydrolase [Candidatus Doudnabacteria bacterium]